MMVLVLSAGLEHATVAPATVHSHQETVATVEVGHAFGISVESERFAEEPTLHCGAPVLGLSLFLVNVPKPCTPSYLPSAFVWLYGDVPDPDPKPPKFPLTI